MVSSSRTIQNSLLCPKKLDDRDAAVANGIKEYCYGVTQRPVRPPRDTPGQWRFADLASSDHDREFRDAFRAIRRRLGALDMPILSRPVRNCSTLQKNEDELVTMPFLEQCRARGIEKDDDDEAGWVLHDGVYPICSIPAPGDEEECLKPDIVLTHRAKNVRVYVECKKLLGEHSFSCALGQVLRYKYKDHHRNDPRDTWPDAQTRTMMILATDKPASREQRAEAAEFGVRCWSADERQDGLHASILDELVNWVAQ